MIPTTDGGFLLAGQYNSISLDLMDYLVMKIDAAGNVIWSKTYGGTNDDVLADILQMPDGNFLLSGASS